jgi:hypothetical protein
MERSFPRISRRRALTVAGGVAAGAAIAQAAAPAFGAAAASTADAIVVGGGLAGLVATSELVAAGRTVLLLDQEPEASLGGQAFWSFGGLFFVDSDEQRLMGIKDSYDLAWQDWLGTAGFDRGVDDPAGQDYWAYKWAQAYVAFAAGEKRSWLAGLGVQWFPIVGWAGRRPGGRARQLGAPLPRHLGHRAGRHGAVREEGAGRRRGRKGDLQVPAPGRRDRPHRRGRHRRTRLDPRTEHCRAGYAKLAYGNRGF